MDSETVKNLDKALDFLYENFRHYYNHDKLKLQCFEDSKDIDVEAIVIKFKEDKITHYGTKDTNTDEFKISIDGWILKEKGGYKWKFKTESIRDFPKDKWYWVDFAKILFGIILGWLFSSEIKQCKNQPPVPQANIKIQQPKPDTVATGTKSTF